MKTTFYKSLDRPIDIFGLKGKWITIFLIGTGFMILMGIIIGSIMGSSYGIATAIVGAFASFFGCLIFQGKLPARRINKARLASKCSVRAVRHENLSRILLPVEGSRSVWFESQEDYKRYSESNKK